MSIRRRAILKIARLLHSGRLGAFASPVRPCYNLTAAGASPDAVSVVVFRLSRGRYPKRQTIIEMASTNATAPDTYSGDVAVDSPSIADALRAFAACRGPSEPRGVDQALATAPSQIAASRAIGNKILTYVPIPQSIKDDAAESFANIQVTADAALSNDPATTLRTQAARDGPWCATAV
jgi:hypothetical protein